MLKATRDNLTAVEDQLDASPQPSPQRFYSHPSASDSFLSESRSIRSDSPFYPSNVILQLRGENKKYRDENLALGEELDEKEAIIRSLRDRVAVLEGEVEDREVGKGKKERERERDIWGDEDDDDDDVDWVEGGLIRGAKRRKL